MLHTTITSLAALCLLMLSSVPAQATCATECSAVPVLDTVSCEPSAIVQDPCAGQQPENCNPSQLTYGWPAELPLSLHVTCTSTCGAGENSTPSTSQHSLTSSDGVRLVTLSGSVLEISFEEPVEACGTQVITASEAVGEAAFVIVTMYLNDAHNQITTVIMQLGESVGEGQGCAAAPGHSREPVQGGWLLLVAGLFAVRRFWSPPSSR